MSTHTDYVATGTNGARRIHRAACKRAKRPAALADLRPADLAGATPASCCKPSATKVGAALLALSTEREAARPAVRGTKREDWTANEVACPHPEAHEGHMALNGECPWCGAVDQSAARPDLSLEQIEAIGAGDDAPPVDDALAVLPYAGSGIAKHYYPVLCKGAALALADALGLTVKATNIEARLVGSPDDVATAKAALTRLWTEDYAEFNEWRRTDEDYLATKAADKGVPWGKSQKRVAELAWLARAVERTVQEVGEGR